MPSIIVVSGPRKGNFYRLGPVTNVIGRDEGLPIQILDNCVSRRHMQISFDPRTWAYAAVDLGSKNGVLINGAKIYKATVLTHGDYITIGNTCLMFTREDFFNRKNALAHIRKVGERRHPTRTV